MVRKVVFVTGILFMFATMVIGLGQSAYAFAVVTRPCGADGHYGTSVPVCADSVANHTPCPRQCIDPNTRRLCGFDEGRWYLFGPLCTSANWETGSVDANVNQQSAQVLLISSAVLLVICAAALLIVTLAGHRSWLDTVTRSNEAFTVLQTALMIVARHQRARLESNGPDPESTISATTVPTTTTGVRQVSMSPTSGSTVMVTLNHTRLDAPIQVAYRRTVAIHRQIKRLDKMAQYRWSAAYHTASFFFVTICLGWIYNLTAIQFTHWTRPTATAALAGISLHLAIIPLAISSTLSWITWPQVFTVPAECKPKPRVHGIAEQ